MINQLKISNFQSHKSTEIEFAPGVNIIVGATDSGKTSLIRALRWLIWNRPSGDAFRSIWGGPTSVSIQMNDNVVTRGKGSENIYKFNGETYRAFGNDVPNEIIKVLNIDETNLQMQLDAPFLISNSPGEVSAYFNRIAHLEKIDTSLKAINKDYNALNSKKGHDEEQLTELQEQLDSFAYLEKLEIELEVLEEQENRVKQKRIAAQNLGTIIKEITEIDDGVEEQQLIIDFEKEVDSILEMWEKRNQKERDYEDLVAALTELENIESKIEDLKRKVKLLPQVDALLLMWEKERALAKEIKEFRKTGSELRQTNADISKVNKKIEKLEEKFHKHMPEVCPLCGK
jgi:exonuclease SbcC